MNYAVKAVKDHFKKLADSVVQCSKMREVVEKNGEGDFATIQVTDMSPGCFGHQQGFEIDLSNATEKRLVTEFINDLAAHRNELLTIAKVNEASLMEAAETIDKISSPKQA